jgi:hypothetical protein
MNSPIALWQPCARAECVTVKTPAEAISSTFSRAVSASRPHKRTYVCVVESAANGGDALGGGLHVAGGTANLSNANLANNFAVGGGGAGTAQAWTEWGGLGGAGSGGAVDVAGGKVAVTGIVVTSNQAVGGNGGWARISRFYGALDAGGVAARDPAAGSTSPAER